jgi:hypothetical protein
MNKAKAFKLAEALESGKYRQAKEALRTKDDRFCCLGVACDLTGHKWEGDSNHFVNYRIFGNDVNIPATLMKQTGFGTTTGEFKKPITVKRKNGLSVAFGSLIHMNDQGLSFEFIAKILRKRYKNIK